MPLITNDSSLLPVSDNDAFGGAARADPPDDAPRLVYADWLDEHGNPDRAAFLRLTCQLLRMSGEDPNRASFEAAANELLFQQQRSWETGLPETLRRRDLGKPEEHGVLWNRGYVEGVAVDCNSFELLVTEIRDNPLVVLRAVELLRPSEKLLRSIFDSPLTRDLTGLFIPNLCPVIEEDPAAITELLGSNPISAVTELWLGNARFPTLEFMTTAPWVSRVEHFGLSGLPEIDVLTEQLAGAQFGRLRTFVLEEPMFVGAEARHHLLGSAHWISGLSKLKLRNCSSFGDLGMIELAGRDLPQFEILDLAGCKVSSHGLRALSQSLWARQVIALNLDVGCYPPDKDDPLQSANALASPRLQSLRKLSIADRKFGDLGLHVISLSPVAEQLTHLNVQGNDLSDGGAIILGTEAFRSLIALDVGNNRFTALGIRQIARAPWIGQLRRCSLEGISLYEDSCRKLAEVPFEKLRYLNLSRCDLRCTTSAILAKAPWASELHWIVLSGNCLGPADIEVWAARCPNAVIEFCGASGLKDDYPDRFRDGITRPARSRLFAFAD